MIKSTSKLFTSNSSWTCPAGVTSVLVGNAYATSAGGSDYSPGIRSALTVVPGTTYTVTVGSFSSKVVSSFSSYQFIGNQTNPIGIFIYWLEG